MHVETVQISDCVFVLLSLSWFVELISLSDGGVHSMFKINVWPRYIMLHLFYKSLMLLWFIKLLFNVDGCHLFFLKRKILGIHLPNDVPSYSALSCHSSKHHLIYISTLHRTAYYLGWEFGKIFGTCIIFFFLGNVNLLWDLCCDCDLFSLFFYSLFLHINNMQLQIKEMVLTWIIIRGHKPCKSYLLLFQSLMGPNQDLLCVI